MMMTTSLLFAGFCSRSDGKISSMQAKKEGNKPQTAILPGDVLTLEDDNDKTFVAKVAKNATCCCIYGVAVNGIQGYTVPVLVRGHVIAHLDTTVFDSITVGSYLKCPKASGKADCCCCRVFVVRKLKAIRNEKKMDCYELLVS